MRKESNSSPNDPTPLEKSLKERFYILTSIVLILFTILQTWLFMNGAYNIEQFILLTLSIFLLYVGLIGGLKITMIANLIFVLGYGLLNTFLYFKFYLEAKIGINQFIWLIITPLIAYIGGLIHEEWKKLLTQLVALVSEGESFNTLDRTVGLTKAESFALRVNQEISRVKRHGGTFSILLIKVEHLKELSDIYGERIRDTVLGKVTEALKKLKREEDSLYYISEGEFALLLPDTNKEGANLMLKRIKQDLNYVDISGEKDFMRIKINIRIGASTYPDDGEDYIPLIWAARKEYEYDIK